MQKPEVLLPGKFTRQDLEKLRQGKIWRVADIYSQQLKELYEISFPDGKGSIYKDFASKRGSGDIAGAWVYYPWSGILLHTVGSEDLFKLRTNRNRNLISLYEQQKLSRSTVAIAGMSVGSGIALACIYTGLSNTIKIADFDKLETANLNRLRESLADIGASKAELAARGVYEINPFADVQIFEAITEQNIDKFFSGPKVSVVVDEIDDFKMKVKLRIKAKECGVPLIMFTSLGDNILIDVERYDRDPKLAIFNGAIGDVADEIASNPDMSPADIKRYAVKLVGQEYVPTKALASLPEIGKTLVGRPQLYSTIAVDGGLAAYLIKKIVLGASVKSGRYFIKFAELIHLPSDDLADTKERKMALMGVLGK